MSIASVSNLPATIYGGVEHLAGEQGVGEYLEAVIELAKTLYPGAVAMRVYVTVDEEAREDERILIELKANIEAGPYQEAHRRWSEGLLRVCPHAGACVFRLGIYQVAR